MKVYIEEDEWYPVYTVIKDIEGGQYEMTEEEYEDYLRIIGDFNELQFKLSNILYKNDGE